MTESISGELVQVVESVWAAIQAKHKDVPGVVVTMGMGSGQKQGALKLGHFAADRWQHGEERLPELFVSGEGLSGGAVSVLATLLHEAAHGVAATRGVQDTSRQGRWHNAKFKATAGELGLAVTKDSKLGWSASELVAGTAGEYAGQIEELSAAIVAYRHAEPGKSDEDKKKSNNGVSAACECGRKVRLSKSVYAQGPIICGLCGTAFTGEQEEEEA
jgi:hypothetical protein